MVEHGWFPGCDPCQWTSSHPRIHAHNPKPHNQRFNLNPQTLTLTPHPTLLPRLGCRYVVQEIIKEMAKNRPVGADGERTFKVSGCGPQPCHHP
jgi:hypothetical protein